MFLPFHESVRAWQFGQSICKLSKLLFVLFPSLWWISRGIDSSRHLSREHISHLWFLCLIKCFLMLWWPEYWDQSLSCLSLLQAWPVQCSVFILYSWRYFFTTEKVPPAFFLYPNWSNNPATLLHLLAISCNFSLPNLDILPYCLIGISHLYYYICDCLSEWEWWESNPHVVRPQIFIPLRLSPPLRFVVWTMPSSVLDANRLVSTPSHFCAWLGVGGFNLSPNLIGFTNIFLH